MIAISLSSVPGSVTSGKRENPKIVFNITVLVGGGNEPWFGNELL